MFMCLRVILWYEICSRNMSFQQCLSKFILSTSSTRKVLSSPLKLSGFIPEKDSELFVRQIPEDSSIEEISEFFGKFGDLYEVKLLMKIDTNQNRGFAYITYMNRTQSFRAIKATKSQSFRGKLIDVSRSVNNCRLFIGNIPKDKNKDQIWNEITENYGASDIDIVDIITFKDYNDSNQTRGFAFIEFRTHERASNFRAKYTQRFWLFGCLVILDWSIPVMDCEDEELEKVKVISIRNLDNSVTYNHVSTLVKSLVDKSSISRVYMKMNFAYIHLTTRTAAEKLMSALEEFYRESSVEVSFSNPPNRYCDKSYRQMMVQRRRTVSFLEKELTYQKHSCMKRSTLHQEDHAKHRTNPRTDVMSCDGIRTNTCSPSSEEMGSTSDWNGNICYSNLFECSLSSEDICGSLIDEEETEDDITLRNNMLELENVFSLWFE